MVFNGIEKYSEYKKFIISLIIFENQQAINKKLVSTFYKNQTNFFFYEEQTLYILQCNNIKTTYPIL